MSKRGRRIACCVGVLAMFTMVAPVLRNASLLCSSWCFCNRCCMHGRNVVVSLLEPSVIASSPFHLLICELVDPFFAESTHTVISSAWKRIKPSAISDVRLYRLQTFHFVDYNDQCPWLSRLQPFRPRDLMLRAFG